MNERDYGVGIANRYALFMGEEGADPLSDVVRSPKGKENKQQDKAAAGKKAQPAAAPAVSKGASSKSAAGPAVSPAAPRTNNTSATGTGPKQSAAPAAGGPAVKSVQKDGKPQAAAGAQQQVKQRQPQSQVTSDQSSGQTVRSGPRPEERQRPAAAADPAKGRPPRAPRPPATDWSAPQSQKDVDERKNRRNKEDQNRGPLQSSNFTGPDNAGTDDKGARGPRDRVFRRDRQPRPPINRPRNDNRDGRGKPVFDRHSGSEKSGVKAVEKRDGAGAHNWGTMNDEIAAQGDAEETQKTETEAPAPAENQENQTNAGESEKAKEPEEEAPKELTLDEWKRQNAAEKRSQPKYNLRKPNEGVDGAQFKKTYLLQKKKEEEESEYEEIEVITEAKENKKKVIDIEINFNETFRGGDDRRGRGGRGGGRGGGRDGFRSDRDRDAAGSRPVAGDDRRKRPPTGPGAGSRKQTAPKVDDVNDFPSLGVAA